MWRSREERCLRKAGARSIMTSSIRIIKDDENVKKIFSTLLNRLSGMADEMSSYFRRMRSVREEQGLLSHHSGEGKKE